MQLTILIHSSKTMLPPTSGANTLVTKPQLLSKAVELDGYLKTLSSGSIAKVMGISKTLSGTTKQLIDAWTANPDQQRPAVDCFLGDIYSGLQASSWSNTNHHFANKSLRILSGLYGILLPSDGIYPYRLEMGYRLPNKKYTSLYKYWSESIAETLPNDGPIMNLSAVEYSKVITEFVDPTRITTPVFYTVSPKTGQPTFVTVHSKVARGAFANWLIQNKVSGVTDLDKFNGIGYKYSPKLSGPNAPAFVANKFGGKGLSIRLQHKKIR